MKVQGLPFFGVCGAIMFAAVFMLAFPSEPPIVEVMQETSATGETAVVDEEDLVAAAAVSQADAVEAPAANSVRTDMFYSVIKVVDGDTITISMNGSPETLRLIGIDTPETVDPRSAVQCFGAEASSKTKELLTGKKVRIEKEASQGERDKYDRLLAYVYREDGLFINKYLVENGYAHEYTYHAAYRHQAAFKAMQNIAKTEGRGLWAPGACDKSSDTIPVAHTAPAPAPMALPAIPAPTHPSDSQPVYTPTPTPQAEPQPSPTLIPVSPPASASQYTCAANTYNCSDFSTHAEAQSVFEMCGGVGHDIHKLDSNKDGEACESLP
ncbi:thermonuclease family protein [Candidatus Kaiserbacteria bacterium]|nr:thermonuclease family protein [Candidatus Kaiserbacteria bacterium]